MTKTENPDSHRYIFINGSKTSLDSFNKINSIIGHTKTNNENLNIFLLNPIKYILTNFLNRNHKWISHPTVFTDELYVL